MDQTKITVRLHPGLAAKFDAQVKSCFIKRDAFLNQILRNEVPLLQEELEGKRLSSMANRYIARRLMRAGAKPVNLLVDKSVAASLNAAVEGAHLVRDAYVNFVLMCLRASPDFLRYFDLPSHYTSSAFDTNLDPAPVSPLQAISDAMWDPFLYLRTAVRERHGVGLYGLSLPEPLHAFSVYLPDEEVPGTQAHEDQIRWSEELLAEFDRVEAAAFAKGERQ